jgi:hypothetical protein
MSEEFTPEEIEKFKSLTDDDFTLIQKAARWAGQKANPDLKNPPTPSPSSKGLAMTLSDLKELAGDVTTRSILRHLLAEAELSPNPGNPKNPPNPKDGKKTSRLGNLL